MSAGSRPRPGDRPGSKSVCLPAAGKPRNPRSINWKGGSGFLTGAATMFATCFKLSIPRGASWKYHPAARQGRLALPCPKDRSSSASQGRARRPCRAAGLRLSGCARFLAKSKFELAMKQARTRGGLIDSLLWLGAQNLDAVERVAIGQRGIKQLQRTAGADHRFANRYP